MCGLAGILTRQADGRDALECVVRRMIGPIAHRGPDDRGVWADAEAGIALGFRRLAILDLSPHGHQPMWSPTSRFVAVFNGEVYNFDDLRQELEGCGFTFRGRSDTEVVLAAFERWGIPAAVERFVGMFAIAVWDVERRELSLVRDRLGKKPLYVYSEPGLVTFGSELKALVAGPSFDRTIDRDALASYLRYLYVPAPRSIFARAAKLPAGHILTISDPACPLPASRPYWSLAEAARDGLADPIRSEEDAIDCLEAAISDAVRARMVSDVPVGALLSGGIDSSTVVAMMQQSSRRAVCTYTIGFDSAEFDEAAQAARVAAYLGTDHTEMRVTGTDARTLIPRLPTIFDEPVADPSQLPTWFVSELARRDVTVALCGDGGDELFGGYNRYVYGTRMLPKLERLPYT
jgi:asparagine synthase (glutamine-hydrolysing)